MSNVYRYKRLGSLGLFVAGIAVLIWILWEVGRPAIEANLAAIGWWFPGFVALFLVAQLFFFAGWWILIDHKLVPSNPWGLFGIYLAGDSINYLIPSANFAGEPLKAHLLRKDMGIGQALTSITIHKHAELVAQWFFLVLGAAYDQWESIGEKFVRPHQYRPVRQCLGQPGCIKLPFFPWGDQSQSWDIEFIANSDTRWRASTLLLDRICKRKPIIRAGTGDGSVFWADCPRRTDEPGFC